MSLRNHNHSTSHAKKSPDATTSALRNWFDRRHLNQSDTSDSNTEKDESSGERKLLSINLNKMLRTRQLLINFDAGRPVVSLKAPLDLINFQSIIRPRWPVECEVISDAIHHIEWDPSEPEPFYQPTGLEKASMPAGEEKGKVVYCVDHTTKYPHFTCSRIGGSRGPIRNATFIGEADSTLQFESRFESGNLLKAVQVGIYEYELTLRPDMYTAKHTQWFYFRVRNMKAGANYCFTIVNLMKSSSLYSVGMRPLLYSERAAKETSVGWRRTGSNIRYFRSCNQVKSSDTVTLHSLTWTVQFPYDSDTCYLAHCYPYTYSHLQRYLRGVASNPAITSYCMLRVLCHSLAGNAVYVLTVTSRGSSVVEDKTKRAVVVTARVHPGETNGSWMMEGFLEFLLGESDDARLLRDTFVFKVVPMLNPDGVIVGNYRCSLAGRDLNRNYKTRLRDSFPTVWHTRNMVERLVNETDVVLYCDFHGHNRKNNVFMYGCNSPGDNALKLQERVFPLMMSKNANNKFSFKSCKFRVQKSKEGTGRITMWRLGVKNSYTMEASFGGSTLGDRKGSHFTTRDLKSIGFYFCDTLLDYCDPDPTKIKYCLAELKVLMRKQVREKLGIDVGSGVTVSDVETSTSGSNSSDSNGLPVHLLKQQQSNQTLKKKKKRLRTFKERNRLRPEWLRSATQPTALQSNFNSATLQESSSHLDNPERIHQKTGIRCGKNSQVRAGNLHTTQRGDVSQVTLWRGCKPVMNKGSCLEEMKTACRDDRGVESRSRCRCSGQMQHLSAPLPPSAKFIRASQQRQLPSLQHSFTSHKNCRGQAPALIDPHSSPMSLKMIPTKCLLSALTTDKFGMQRRLGDRNTSGVFEHYSLEDSPTIKTKLNDKEQEKDSAGLTESKSHTSLFVPVLRSRPPRAALLCKDKGCVDVLLPVLKPSVLDKMVHPRSVTLNQLQGNHGRRHQSGREHRAMTAPQAPSGRRASQPALL